MFSWKIYIKKIKKIYIHIYTYIILSLKISTYLFKILIIIIKIILKKKIFAIVANFMYREYFAKKSIWILSYRNIFIYILHYVMALKSRKEFIKNKLKNGCMHKKMK